jgi:hypothetical protein
MRPLENGVCANGEVQQASVAAVETVLPCPDTFPAAALWAERAVGPKAGFEVFPGAVRVWNQLEKLEGTDGAFAHFHFLAGLIMPKSAQGVKYIIPKKRPGVGARFPRLRFSESDGIYRTDARHREGR